MKPTHLLGRVCLASLMLLYPAVVGAFGSPPGEPAKVKIGLLVPGKNSLAARQGAELAVILANEKGGFNGRPFELLTRSMEGPWGTGSKQAVDLIFNFQVCAILGSHDGRNGHLVEQVSAKTRVVFLSAWAGDPTLSEAFVPWYFSCIPNDLQQAAAIIHEVYDLRKMNRVALVTDEDYDAQSASAAFLKKLGQAGKPKPLLFSYPAAGKDQQSLPGRISQSGAQAILLFCAPGNSRLIMGELRKAQLQLPVFGSLLLLNEDILSGQDFGNFDGRAYFPTGEWDRVKFEAFSRAYRNRYKKEPGAMAAYAFDGMSMLIEAMRKTGLEEPEMQKTLSTMQFEGVTGNIHFDDKGNRTGYFSLKVVSGGIPLMMGLAKK